MADNEHPAFFIYVRSPEGKNELKCYNQHIDLKLCLISPEHWKDFLTPNVSENAVTTLLVPENTSLALEPGEFQKFPNLTELEVRFATNTPIPTNLFINLHKLEDLSLKGGSSANLPKDVFNGLERLKRLEVTSQRIITLDEGVLDSLTALKTLRLLCPNLEGLDGTLFTKLRKLARLSVYAKFCQLHAGVFSNLNQLEELVVSGDKEEFQVSSNIPLDEELEENIRLDLEPGTVDGLQNLESLNLSYNGLTDITFNLETLKSLNLQSNMLTSFQPEMTGLEHLVLSNNLIKSIDINVLSNLITLSLNGNPLGYLKPYQFANLLCLEILDLSNCNIKAIEKGNFVGLKNLKNLSLSHNNIDHLAPDVFEKLESLQVLDLSDNSISNFDPAPFLPLEKLETLNIENNGITVLSVEMFTDFVCLKVVFIHRNNMDAEQMQELQKNKPELQFVF